MENVTTNNGEVRELNAQVWFEDNVHNDNKDDLLKIGELAKRILGEKFSLGLYSAESPLAIFALVYKTIIDELKLMREDKREFKINIANIIEIGYDSPSNEEENEKTGNFAPTLRHLGSSKPVDSTEENTSDDVITSMAINIATKWNAINSFENIEIIKSIEQKSLTKLIKEAGIHLGSVELPIPIFCTVYETMTGYLLVKMNEEKLDEIEIDIMGLFKMRVEFDNDGNTKISLSPGVYTKMELKDDAKSYNLYHKEEEQA